MDFCNRTLAGGAGGPRRAPRRGTDLRRTDVMVELNFDHRRPAALPGPDPGGAAGGTGHEDGPGPVGAGVNPTRG